MTKRTCGHTKSGRPVDDDLIEQLAREAEDGYDVDEIVSHRGNGADRDSAPAVNRRSVRLDPELDERLALRAVADGVAVSEVVREALRHHVEAS